MCGIFGAVGGAGWLESLRLGDAVGSMAHRGPDGSGVWRSPSREEESGARRPACVLGHRRLSIIDLSDAGRQPMTTSDGRYTLVYNGEVYNYRDLRRELEELGETFHSTGDSEVVLKACARWGASAVERFRGMFALALWDQEERRLLLARDRLGVKPLYIVRNALGLAFASEVRAILAAEAAPRVVSVAGLKGYLRFGSVQEPYTLVDGVRSLAPGSVLEFDGQALRESRFWHLPTGRPESVGRFEAVERLRELLHESVRIRLVSDVPFGVFLSGGIDSSAITALASAEAGRPVHTFTVVFDEAAHSEEKWAADAAARHGCDHHSVRMTGREAAEALPIALADQDQPSADGLNSWYVSRAARQAGLAMALSGLGGDEVFAGYPGFRRIRRLAVGSRLASGIPRRLLAALGRRAAAPGTSHRLRKAVALAQAGGNPRAVYRALRFHFTNEQVDGLLCKDLGGRAMTDEDERAELEPSDDPVNDLSRFELAGYLRNTLLRDTDTMSMACSLEVRVPFLDHVLVEYALGLPGRMKLEGRGNKALLVEAVSALPEETGSRPKMGFVLPLEGWFRTVMREHLEEALLGAAEPTRSVLGLRPVEGAWRAFLASKGSVSATRIFALVSLSAWIDRHRLTLPS